MLVDGVLVNNLFIDVMVVDGLVYVIVLDICVEIILCVGVDEVMMLLLWCLVF